MGFKNVNPEDLIVSIWFSKTSIWIFVDGYLDSLNLWYIIDIIPFSLAKNLLEVWVEYDISHVSKNTMINFIIDTSNEKIFLKIINNDKEYINNIKNSRENFDELVNIIFNFLYKNNINLSKIDNIFINRGPGKFTSIWSAISIVKALKISKNINIYGFDSGQITNNNYDKLFKLLKEGRLTKNFIEPKYLN